nr:hypothetical protein [Pseudoclavibacter sp. Marseille-Q3772]
MSIRILEVACAWVREQGFSDGWSLNQSAVWVPERRGQENVTGVVAGAVAPDDFSCALFPWR